ncbi:unnamed protein product [Chrysoparadoxa australica]
MLAIVSKHGGGATATATAATAATATTATAAAAAAAATQPPQRQLEQPQQQLRPVLNTGLVQLMQQGVATQQGAEASAAPDVATTAAAAAPATQVTMPGQGGQGAASANMQRRGLKRPLAQTGNGHASHSSVQPAVAATAVAAATPTATLTATPTATPTATATATAPITLVSRAADRVKLRQNTMALYNARATVLDAEAKSIDAELDALREAAKQNAIEIFHLKQRDSVRGLQFSRLESELVKLREEVESVTERGRGALVELEGKLCGDMDQLRGQFNEDTEDKEEVVKQLASLYARVRRLEGSENKSVETTGTTGTTGDDDSGIETSIQMSVVGGHSSGLQAAEDSEETEEENVGHAGALEGEEVQGSNCLGEEEEKAAERRDGVKEGSQPAAAIDVLDLEETEWEQSSTE